MLKMTTKVYCNGKQIAAFASELIARRFAIRFTLLYPWCIELHHKDGIVGQYVKGETTPEFSLHHEACFVDEPQ